MKVETTGPLLYRAGYKYRVERDFGIKTPFGAWPFVIPDLSGGKPWCQVASDGWLYARAGYCYDGPSGPTLDCPISILAAIPHDVPYQGARLGHLPQDDEVRKMVDVFFRDLLVALGFDTVRADLYYEGIRVGAGYAWRPQLEEVLEAPSGKVHLVQPGSARATQLLALVPA